MQQTISLITVLVNDYDQAIDFYTNKIGFELVEDVPSPDSNKRWVVVAPPGAKEARLLLALTKGAEQQNRVGKQVGKRVFLFLHTDDLLRDFEAYANRGVTFIEQPTEKPHGIVAVFEDLYGNRWDLIQPKLNK